MVTLFSQPERAIVRAELGALDIRAVFVCMLVLLRLAAHDRHQLNLRMGIAAVLHGERRGDGNELVIRVHQHRRRQRNREHGRRPVDDVETRRASDGPGLAQDISEAHCGNGAQRARASVDGHVEAFRLLHRGTGFDGTQRDQAAVLRALLAQEFEPGEVGGIGLAAGGGDGRVRGDTSESVLLKAASELINSMVTLPPTGSVRSTAPARPAH